MEFHSELFEQIKFDRNSFPDNTKDVHGQAWNKVKDFVSPRDFVTQLQNKVSPKYFINETKENILKFLAGAII